MPLHKKIKRLRPHSKCSTQIIRNSFFFENLLNVTDDWLRQINIFRRIPYGEVLQMSENEGCRGFEWMSLQFL